MPNRAPTLFTKTARGYYRWYKGKTRWVCSIAVPPDQVEDKWIELKDSIDNEKERPSVSTGMTYRQVLSMALKTLRLRLTDSKRPLAERSFHNYSVELNRFGQFEFNGVKVADLFMDEVNTPLLFAAYAAEHSTWKASAWESVVSRVTWLFKWAEGMELIDRFRPGPEFRRPAKKVVRDERIQLAKSFEPAEIGTLYRAANPQMKAWIALGICAAFTPSDIAHLTTDVLDIETGVIDFQRRKTGRIRRVIPLPAEALAAVTAYQRAAAADPAHEPFVFLTDKGLPWSRTKSEEDFKPSCSISRLFAKLADGADLERNDKQGFSGLRTTFRNIAPRDGYDLEREVIMGHAQGSIDLDNYLEDVGLDRLRHVVNHVWAQVWPEMNKSSD